jgi:hypothetical protein
MDKEKYISGIYNYCDRWCEKCAFTARCRVYATEQSVQTDLPDDPDSPEFWEHLKNNFQDTLEMLQGLMEQLEEKSAQLRGDDDDDAKKDDDLFEDFDQNDDDERPPQPFSMPDRVKWPDHYGDEVHDFFQKNEDFFGQQEEKFDSQIRMGLPVDVESLGFLHEALQTIRWFQHLIGAKIHRSLSQIHFDKNFAIEQQSDGNGSAKIAMIGLQKSADAWKFVEGFFPEKQLEVQQILRVLAETKQQLEKNYPDWDKFHRPGFDDEPDTVVRLDYNPN